MNEGIYIPKLIFYRTVYRLACAAYDIANAVCFLASSEASFVNGAVFVVDGGGEVIADRNSTFVAMDSITVQEADRTGVQ